MVIFPKAVTQNVESFVEGLSLMKVTRLFAVTSLIRNILTFLEMKLKNEMYGSAANGGKHQGSKGRFNLDQVLIWLIFIAIQFNNYIPDHPSRIIDVYFVNNRYSRYTNGNVLQKQ